MREARDWFAREFNPSSIDDVAAAAPGRTARHFRMVTSYWDMAASFVANGAIDEQMFNDANGEQLVILAKLEPFLAEYRTRVGQSQLPVAPGEAGDEAAGGQGGHGRHARTLPRHGEPGRSFTSSA